MGWFFPALICVLGWGFADFFYKRGSDGQDLHSHLKIAVWVGLVMGVCALILLPFTESGMSPAQLAVNIVRYAPASAFYILSMIIGYVGLRYLELSIASPVQNASGALSAIFIIIYFVVTGRQRDILQTLSVADLVGTGIIVIGMIALAIAEQRLADTDGEASRFRRGAKALLFPLLYCLFDTVGTAADGIILNEETGLGLGELDVIVLYGITFWVVGIFAWLYLRYRTGEWYNPFSRQELPKAAAAGCEEFGQVFYVFAMTASPVLTAPTVASYCVVSVLLSRFLLREKLNALRYGCIITVVIGIVLLGVAEGMAEKI